MRARHWVTISVALSALACGSKSSVSLSAQVQDPTLAVEQATLGTRLTGGFSLRLALGSEASGNTSVSLESFALLRGSDRSTLVSPLPAAPQGVQFPLDVRKGDSQVVPFVLDDQSLLDQSVKDAICAEPVRIVGAVRDTLSGGDTTSFESIDLVPNGC